MPAPSGEIGQAHPTYVCPMHPQIVQDHPGTCPICGMALVPMKDAGGEAASQIHVDTATQYRLGLQLASASPATLTHDVTTFGTLVPDEGAVLRITPNIDGLLTKLNVSRIGQQIEPGQVLFEMTSQDALNLQYEYVDILRRGKPAKDMADARREKNRKDLENAQTLEPAARELVERGVHQSEDQLWSLMQPLERDGERVKLRLQQIGFTNEMIKHLVQTEKAYLTIPMRATRSCVVQSISARPGMTVGRMTEILSCVDTAHAEIEVALYPDQLSWVEAGNPVTIGLDDGTTTSTKLTGLNPLLDETTHTIQVRIPVAFARPPNLGEYAQVVIHTTPRQVLAVPKTAVMRTGHGNFVMRSMGQGHFMPVKVLTGIEDADHIGIREGLSQGDQVAVNGQFLMDAAASIADSAQRMQVPHPVAN